MIQMLTKNLGVKLICMILAFGMWYSMKAEEIVSTAISMKVLVLVNDQMAATLVRPDVIQVQLSGNRRILRELELKEHVIKIDLKGESLAKVVRTVLTPLDLGLPEGILVTEIEPEIVEVEIDRLVQQVFDVDTPLQGEVAPSYRVTQIQTFPSRLNITGPEKLLGEIKKVSTEPINIGNLSTTVMQTVSIIEPYASLKGTEPIKVFVKIGKSKVDKRFDELPIRVLQPMGPPLNVSIKPGTVDIEVSGSDLDFQGMGRESFIPYIEMEGLESGEYELPVYLIKKDNLKLKSMDPKAVQVSISGEI